MKLAIFRYRQGDGTPGGDRVFMDCGPKRRGGMVKRLTMGDIEMGQTAFYTKTITEGDIFIFAGLTGDLNPIHIDENFAKNTKFKKRIAHGLVSVSLIGAAIGSELPGEGSVYVSQDVKFKSPVFPGDTITAKIEVIGMDAEKNRLTLKTTCENQDGLIVVDGTAVAMPAKNRS
jgi:3-hydroxybutyryl-CoA dehydratase